MKEKGILKMKKTRIFLPFLALTLTLGLAACNGPKPTSGEQSQPKSSIPAQPKIAVTAENNKTTLVLGESVQLKSDIEGVEWASADANIATVSTSGLVESKGIGEVKITAKKEGYQNGTITITVKRPAATATLHFEQADHYSADGEWINSNRGPGETPVYDKSSASDGTCIGYFGEGDKETLTFTSDKAVKAELVVTMGHNSSFSPLSDAFDAKFNNAALDLSKAAYESDTDGQGGYTFQGVSFGNVNLIAGNNVLEITMKGNVPYLDDLEIYAESAATIAIVPAPEKEKIIITNPETDLTFEAESTLQLTCNTQGVTWASSNESIATVNETGLVTGVAKGSATITARKDGMLTGKVTVKITEKLVDGELIVQVESGTGEGITFRTSYNTDTEIIDAWPQGAVLTLNFTATKAGAFELYLYGRASGGYQSETTDKPAEMMEIKINNTAVELSGEIAPGAFALHKIGEVNLNVGANTMTVKNLGETITTIDYFRLVPKAAK